MDYRDDSGGLLLRAAALEEEIEGLRASVLERKQELAEAKSTPVATPTATTPEERLATLQARIAERQESASRPSETNTGVHGGYAAFAGLFAAIAVTLLLATEHTFLVICLAFSAVVVAFALILVGRSPRAQEIAEGIGELLIGLVEIFARLLEALSF
jgi:Flp pilus assembly protein TadB